MAFNSNHNIGVDLTYRGHGAAAQLAQLNTVQGAAQRAMARGSAQQMAQLNKIQRATKDSMFKTGTGAGASLAHGLNNSSKRVHQAGNNLVSVAQKHAVRLGGMFQQMGFQAQLAGMTLTRAFTVPAVAAVGLGTAVGIKLAAKLESATTALKALLPAGYNVEALINRLRKTAIKSPVFNTPQLVDFTRKLVASGVEVGKTEKIMASLGRVFQTFGVTGEGVDLAMRGVGQAFSKGKLQAEELTGQIGEQIPALSLLARAAGVTQGEFLKMVREGKITSDVFADLLIKIGNFPEIMKGATGSINTMQGAWDRLKEAAQDALAQAFLKHTKEVQKALEGLEKAIPEIAEAFGPIVPRLVEGFARILNAVASVVQWYNRLDKSTKDLVNKFLGILVVSGPVILFFAKVNTLAGAATTFFRLMLNPLGLLVLGFAGLTGLGVATWLNKVGGESRGLTDITGRLGEGWNSASSDASGLSGKARDLEGAFGRVSHSAENSKDGVKRFGAQLRNLWDAITQNLVPAVGDFITKLKDELKPALSSLGDSIDFDVLPALTDFTNKLASWINENGDKIAEAAGEWAKKFVDGIAGGIREGNWKKVGHTVGDAIGDAVGAVGDFSDMFDKWASNTDWVEVGKTVGEHAGGFIIGLMAGFGDDLVSADFWKKHWLDAIIAAISIGGIGKIAGPLTKLGKKIPWHRLFDGLRDLGKKIPWGTILAPFRRIGGAVKAVWDDFIANLEEVFPRIAERFRGFVDLVRNAPGKIAGFFRGVWDDFVNNIREVFPRASAALKSGLESLYLRMLYLRDRVLTVFRNLGGRIVGLLDKGLMQPIRNLGLRFRNAVLLAIGRFLFLSWLVQAGKDIVQGLINGLIEKGKEAWKSFKDNVLDPIVNGFKSFFGISSPSTLMHGFGGDIVQGLINGMLARWGQLTSQVRNIWASITSTVSGSAQNVLSGVSMAWDTLIGRTRSTFDGLLGIASSRWTAIKENAKASAGNVLSSLTTAWGIAVGRTRSTFDGLLGIVRSRWEAIKGNAKASADSVLANLTTAWNIAIGRTRSAWDGLRSIVATRFSAMRDDINRIWLQIRGILVTFGRFARDGVSHLIRQAVSLITSAWSRTRGAFRDPINWVIKKVINEGISRAWNTVAGWLKIGTRLGTLPYISENQRFESGGVMGTYERATAIVGEGNTNHPEYVIPTEPKYRKRALGLYSELGAKLMESGGRLDGRPTLTGARGGPMEFITSIPEKLMAPIRGALAKKLNAPMGQTKDKLNYPVGKIVRGLPQRVIDEVWAIAKNGLAGAGLDVLHNVASKLGLKSIASQIMALFGGLGSDNSSSVSAILAVAKRFYSGARVSSGKRNTNDYHGQGLAADLIGGGRQGMLKIAQGFYGMRGSLLELIHSAGRGYFVKNGRAVSAGFYRSVIGQHYNHVHVAARRDALMGGAFFGGSGGGSLGAWIRQAMRITRTPGNWYQALYNLALHESGGRPTAQNNWDINAKRGTPSKGLFQTIPGTFAAYSLPGMKNIWNPVHNAVAAIRYIKARYGSIFRIPSYRSGNRFVGGYANGTPYVPATGLALVHKGERIIPASQNKGGSFGGIHIHFDGPVYAERREIEDIVVAAVETAKRKRRIK